jgi:predicted ATPase
MLTRLYIDNYKCFSNFELTLGPMQLLLGDNGTGKSSVLDVVAGLQGVLMRSRGLSSAFGSPTLTRWDTRQRQTFEVDVLRPSPAQRYRYRLELDVLISSTRIAHESLSCNGSPIYQNEGSGEARIFLEDDTSRQVLVDPFASAIASVPLIRADELLWFRRFMARLVVLRPRPASMVAVSSKDEDRLLLDGTNFSAWYRARDLQQPFPIKQALHKNLSEALSGFESLLFSRSGEDDWVLKTRWNADLGASAFKFELRFDELSDGQRMLIVLYTLLSLADEADPMTLLLDEPANYVSLAEIEPWLGELEEQTEHGMLQAIIASHHPELLNAWAGTHGIRFSRRAAGPARAQRFTSHDDDPLTPAERIARGWDDDGDAQG